MKLFELSALCMLAAIMAGCKKIPFDADGNKIISFSDGNFKKRITPYFDTNGDGYISIHEAQNGRKVPCQNTTAERVVMDCDNADGSLVAIHNIGEVKYFKNVEILKFRGNKISGTLDLKMLKSLKEIDLADNGGIVKIILNTAVKAGLIINKDPDTELEYYTDPKE